MNDTDNRTRDCYWDAYRTLNNLADQLFDLDMRMTRDGCTCTGLLQAQEILRSTALEIVKNHLQPLPVEVS